jgi:IrrE N-terminal-like domain
LELIEQTAERVLAQVPPYVWDGTSPPVPVSDIASSFYGLLIRDMEDLTMVPGSPKLDRDETLSGLLLASRGEIWVNAAEAREWPTRRRFTIGHELGHWVMHRDDERTVFCRSKTVQPDEDADENAPDIEEEASIFAAALLMPAEMLRREYARNRDFEHLCELFQASGAAMGRRLHAVI